MDATEQIDAIHMLLQVVPQKQESMPTEEWMGLVDRFEKSLVGGDILMPAMKHRWAHRMYIRECPLNEGDVIATRLTLKPYPFFLVEGTIHVRSANGHQFFTAPFFNIVPAGTRRIVYSVTESRAMTCHATDFTTVDEVMDEYFAPPTNTLLSPEERNKISGNIHQGNLLT